MEAVSMGSTTVQVGCPTCEDGTHYVRVDYDFVQPHRHFDGEWVGSDDCGCALNSPLLRTVEENAETMVATGDA